MEEEEEVGGSQRSASPLRRTERKRFRPSCAPLLSGAYVSVVECAIRVKENVMFGPDTCMSGLGGFSLSLEIETPMRKCYFVFLRPHVEYVIKPLRITLQCRGHRGTTVYSVPDQRRHLNNKTSSFAPGAEMLWMVLVGLKYISKAGRKKNYF